MCLVVVWGIVIGINRVVGGTIDAFKEFLEVGRRLGVEHIGHIVSHIIHIIVYNYVSYRGILIKLREIGFTDWIHMRFTIFLGIVVI